MNTAYIKFPEGRTYHRMIPALLFLVLAFAISACSSGPEANHKPQKNNTENRIFPNWQIEKNRLGPIRLGMSMKQVAPHLSQFERVETEPIFYGYDGGGIAYEYRLNNELVFAIIPHRDVDSIIAIAVVHPDLKTKTGLSTGSTVADILLKYPSGMVYLVLMSNDEHIPIDKGGITFVFNTDETNRIGSYSIPDKTESVPQNTTAKPDYILI